QRGDGRPGLPELPDARHPVGVRQAVRDVLEALRPDEDEIPVGEGGEAGVTIRAESDARSRVRGSPRVPKTPPGAILLNRQQEDSPGWSLRNPGCGVTPCRRTAARA